MDRYWLNQPESIIQYIWQQLLFDDHQLQTDDGKSLCILSAGKINQTDGPDFIQARFIIDGIEWHGSVELHIHESDWFNHNHQNDPNYNNCVLHVFLKDGNHALCQNGSVPFSLNLLPRLSSHLAPFLFIPDQKQIPCQSIIQEISNTVFEKQLEKASKEYFDQKIEHLNSLYDGSMKPSIAWKKALCLALWEGFGIQHNKEQMLVAAQEVLRYGLHKMDVSAFEADALSHIKKLILKREIKWNYKSVRPNNHPEVRIKQAILLTHKIMNTDLSYFMSTDVLEHWHSLLRTSNLNHEAERMKTLLRVYYLPALYFLASLFYKSDLQNLAFSLWKDQKQKMPGSINKYYSNAGFESSNILKHPGLYPQWKNYSERSQCFSCFVFKSAIES